jgi:hypothetical protein
VRASLGVRALPAMGNEPAPKLKAVE